MAEMVRKLWAYSTYRGSLDQEDRFLDTMQPRAVSISWFILSDCPLHWGWYPEERHVVAPIRLQSSFQNTDKNWEPRLATISTGRPYWWCRTSCAVSLAISSLDRGTRCAILLKLSTTVWNTVFPSVGERPMTKSKEMLDQDQCGTGRGWRSPAGAR